MFKTSLPAGRPVLAMLCALTLLVAATTILHAQSGPLEDLANFPRTSLDILHGKDKKSPRTFTVWIADTPARQEQGLMFVQDLPAGQGMLFPQKKLRQMSMWMKNTYIELDMVFIGENGAIDQIIEHAHPLSLDTLSSVKKVASVLELKGGEVARLELKVGDRVNWTPPEGCECVITPSAHALKK
jgi:uncharacterized membrane protein (UPF0127 family)